MLRKGTFAVVLTCVVHGSCDNPESSHPDGASLLQLKQHKPVLAQVTQHQQKADKYNCDEGEVSNWINKKKNWCCRKKNKGCKFNCFTREIWSNAKSKWCCRVKKRRCTEPTTPPPPRACKSPSAAHGEVNRHGPGLGGCQECTCVNGVWDCSCVLRTRKEINDMTDEEFELLAWGINKLKENGKWAHITKVHLDHHLESHRTDRFLYWHRRYLMEVENLIQKVIHDEHPTEKGSACSVTLPYWNWAMDKGEDENSVVFHDDRYGSLNNGLNWPKDNICVKTGKFAAAFDKKADVVRYFGSNLSLQCIMRAGSTRIAPENWMEVKAEMEDPKWNGNPDFVRLSQVIEQDYHNSIHGAIGGIGGHMRTMASPYDPIFFLHHGFVDYLWYHWQAHHVSDADHKDGSLTATGLLDEDASGSQQANSDFEESMHMLEDNPNTVGHSDFTCVAYAERQSALCEGKDWLSACMEAIALDSEVRPLVPRVIISPEDPSVGKLANLCSAPTDDSHTRHAKVWLDGLLGMGMISQNKVDQIIQQEEMDMQKLETLLPLNVKLNDIPEDHRECSRKVCVNTEVVENICNTHFPDLMR